MNSMAMDMDMGSSSASATMNMIMSTSSAMMSAMTGMPTSSSSMEMMMNMHSSASSASSMDMDMGMNMSSSSASATTSMNMNMGSMTMSMPTSSSSATASMDMDMSSGDSMSMKMYMTTGYKGIPVFFKTLDAHSGGAAFGIFCVLFFACFAFRGLCFLSTYLEQKIFHNLSQSVVIEEDCECAPEPKVAPEKTAGQIIKKMFWMGPKELYRDVIRLILSFTIVMFGYVIMLAAMSFVVLYFFAICLGFAFAEIFFNRLAMLLEINKSAGSAGCGLH